MIRNIQTYDLPGSEYDKAFQIYEVKGKNFSNQDYPHQTKKPHRHNYYEICLFVNGSGKHEIDFKSYVIQSRSVHFLSPGQVHLISRDENYSGYLLVFSKDFYSLNAFQQGVLFNMPFFNNYNSTPILNLNNDEYDELLQLFQLMRKEYVQQTDISQDVLRSLLHVFLLKCKHYFYKTHRNEEKIKDPHYALVQQFKSLLEQNYTKIHQVKDFASLLSISPSALNTQIKRITGVTAGEMIIDRLILQAKRLLLYTRMSNKEVAFHLNYEDPSYFSRLFKKKTGYSPSDFRIEMHKKYQI